MDEKLTTQSAWLYTLAKVVTLGACVFAISLSAISMANAGEAIASDTEKSSTIFITDDSVGEPPSLPETAWSEDKVIETRATDTDTTKFVAPKSPAGFIASGSVVAGSVVFVEDNLTPTPTALTPALVQPASVAGSHQQTAARGDLKVIANRQQVPKVTAARPSIERTALAPLAEPSTMPLPAQPVAPQPVAPQLETIAEQPVARPMAESAAIQLATAAEPLAGSFQRDQPGDIQIAVHDEQALEQRHAAEQTVEKSDAVARAELLINAYRLSLQAKTESEYTRIAEACGEAIRLGANHDRLTFATQLASWALNRRGQLRSDAEEYDMANADFQAAIDFNPKNWRALHNRGVSYAQAGQFAESFDDFNAVIQLNPEYAKAYANRATLYVQANDLQSAIKDYELSLRHDREFATAHVGLARVCHMLGQHQEAVEHFTAAVELDPTSAQIVCSRGDLHADMGNYGEALADYARTIELAPEFAHAYRNGAWLLATCPDEQYRDAENAVLGAQQALEYSYGEEHIALDTLAAALAANGQFDEAIATETRAVDMAPEDAKFTYLSRLQLYQQQEPFRTEPVGDVSQATYEATDQ